MPELNRIQFRTYYHGTDERNVESILKEGLKANTPGAGEYWYDENDPDPGHPHGVYFSNTIEGARAYGSAVFAADLPDTANWKWSENGEVLGHDLPPFFLRRIE
jgi:hypothetical protein